MKQMRSILFYVDAEADPAILDRVLHIAKVVGAKLTLAAVVKPARSQILLTKGCLDLDEVERLLVEDRQRQLDEAANTIDDHDVTITTRVFLGDPVDAIIRAVMTEEYDFPSQTTHSGIWTAPASCSAALICDCCVPAPAP